MKICEYCGSKLADNVLQCNSCGSKEFKNICINCGITFSGIKCPACSVIVGDKPKVCFNCGEKVFEKICPECGADLINGRQVQADNYSIPRTKTKKKISARVVLLLLIFFAVMVSIISKSKASIKNTISDNELLSIKNHPKFYDDYNEAKKFWNDYDKVKVVNARQTRYNEDALLLITTGDEDNNVITNVTINLSNVENKQDIRLDNVLKLICSYIPYDIIDEYYTFEESFHETHKSESYEAYHYIMTINDSGKSANKSGDRHLESKFAFKIIHRNDDWIANINYLSYEGNHHKFNPDAYDVKSWDINIHKYK